MKTTEIIRANFEKFLFDNGDTVAKLADRQGVRRQTIYSYFRPGVSLSTIEKMAQLVGVQPWELLKPIDTANDQENPAGTIACPHCGKTLILRKYDNTDI